MLRLELIEDTQKEAMYRYFPEHGEEYGTLSINKETGELNVMEVSTNDEHKRYLFHAIRRLERYFAEKDFRERDVVAWY